MDKLRIPDFVNYACEMCGWCCRQYDISFSQADFDRLSKTDWDAVVPELAGKQWAAPIRQEGKNKFRLRYSPAGGCVFLKDNACLMHPHVGEMGKVLGCCVYPFTFARTPSGVYVGLRFSCRSVAHGTGETIAHRHDSLTRQLKLCERAGHVPVYGGQAQWHGGTSLDWADYIQLEELFIRVFLRDDLPIKRRLFLAWKLLDILRQARLDRVRGEKFKELLGILETGLFQEAVDEPIPEKPNAFWRMMFRQYCFLFQRRQGGSYRELSILGKLGARLEQFWTGLKYTFAFGRPQLAGTTDRFSVRQVEKVSVGELGVAEEAAISRFLSAKLFGKQYFGKLFYDYSVEAGLQFLLLSAGAVMWYARARALTRGHDHVAGDDVIEAIRTVDFSYGYSAAPSLPLERLRIRLLSHGDKAIRAVSSQF